MDDSWGEYPLRSLGQQSSESQDHGKLHKSSWQFLSPLLLRKSSPFVIFAENIFLKRHNFAPFFLFCHRSGKVWKWKSFWVITWEIYYKYLGKQQHQTFSHGNIFTPLHRDVGSQQCGLATVGLKHSCCLRIQPALCCWLVLGGTGLPQGCGGHEYFWAGCWGSLLVWKCSCCKRSHREQT